jgi:hypothetical protein
MCDLKEVADGLSGPMFGQIAVGRCTRARAFDCACLRMPPLGFRPDQALNLTRGNVISIPNQQAIDPAASEGKANHSPARRITQKSLTSVLA